MELSIWLAFGAGILSFVSPCVLPLYPSFISYISGVSVGQLSDRASLPRKAQRSITIHTILFVVGLSVIFFALGSAVTFIGELFSGYQETIRMLGAIIIVIMGLFLIGVFQPTFLMKEKRVHYKSQSLGYVGSFFVGMAFAAGWTPCIGPIMTSVLTLSATNPSQGLLYTSFYSLGFAIPFLVMSFFLSKTKLLVKYSKNIMKGSGAIMIVLGLLLYFDQMSSLTLWLSNLFGGFRGF
ncbi:cytochrome c biogenesis CcdA family protein [Pontibacillus salicampi]|uniref:Cytochrome c biogenesis CcdA family protein n=1 Tax=Pontibacillus salicampi TaxID=1449801 RepID=A0ABV6LKB6_9BACI